MVRLSDSIYLPANGLICCITAYVPYHGATQTPAKQLLLEIAARSDTRTIVRCAAAGKTLHHRILAATFIQRQAAAGVRVLTRLHTRRRKPLVSLVYPVASSFVRKQLSPFVSRRTADLLPRYDPVASCGGLLVLRRRQRLRRCNTSGSDLCVYDPMSGARTSLSEPPDISMDGKSSVRSYVLLTAADGIGCSSFLLLVADMNIHPVYRLEGRYTMRAQTATSLDSNGITWGPVTEYICSGPFKEDGGAVVLPGGVIHWLNRDENEIFTYDVRTGNLDTIKHPGMPVQRHLAMSSDGGLRILAVRRFIISIWLQLSTGSWAQDAVIDTEEKMRSLDPNIPHGLGLGRLKLRCSGETRSNVVLLQMDGPIIVLDLEKGEMRRLEDSTSSFLFEVDLSARLHAMKVFS